MILTLQKIDNSSFNELIKDATVLEKDGLGVKVFELPNKNILKIFRVKSTFSKYQFIAPCKRFAKNASCLAKLGISTLEVKMLYQLPQKKKTAALYKPLVGKDLKSIAKQEVLSDSLLIQLGEFIAELHNKGIYFRSLHLGNIILTPNNQLGLIDILDMQFHKTSLGNGKRLRNFRHFSRLLEKEPENINSFNTEILRDAYRKASNCNINF